MRAVDVWFEKAKEAYEGDGLDPLYDRIFRAKAGADQVIFNFLILEELRRLVGAVEASQRPSGATKHATKR